MSRFRRVRCGRRRREAARPQTKEAGANVAYEHNKQVPDRKPLLIFDGHCGFCRIWIEYWKKLSGDRLDYAPSQEVADQFPQIPREEFNRSVQLVRSEE